RTSARKQNVGETVKEQVGKASETLRSNDLLDELRNGLATGLRELNEQLQRISERLEHRGDTPTATAAEATPAADVTTTPASTPEVDPLLTAGGSGTAPSVDLAPEQQGDLPTQPEGPSTVEKV